MKAINIKTEYLDNPINLGIKRPRIFWNVDEGIQESFIINFKINDKDFSSGKIKSNLMHYDFPYDLKERDSVKFRITLFSLDGKMGDVSDENSFEIGITDFNSSKWISGNYYPKRGKRYPCDYFKKEFYIDKEIKKARLYASANGIYYSYINNNEVSNLKFSPGSTDYNKRVQVEAFDCTNLIKKGKNEISFILGDGWYRGSNGAKGRLNTYGKVTKIIAKLEIIFVDDEILLVDTDKSFKWSNDGEILFNDLRDGEIVDLNKMPSYSNYAREVKGKNNFYISNNYHVNEHEVFEPVNIIKHDKSTVYSFKQNLAGYVEIVVEAKENDTLKMKFSEILDKNNHADLSNIQLIHKKKLTPLQEITLYLKNGINIYKPKFSFFGFRHVEVFTNAKVKSIKQIALYTSYNLSSGFTSSNELLNTFYKNTLWSLKSNSIDIPTDCPTRERIGWLGDSQVFFNTAAYLTSIAPFARKHITDIFDTMRKNGRISQIAPFSNEDWFMNAMNGSVGWADACVLIPYRYYLIYKDERILKDNFLNMLKYAKFMINRCGKEKGIYSVYAKRLHLSKENRKYQVNTGQSYGEWAEPSDVKAFYWKDFAEPHPEESMAYTHYILSIMVNIEDILNRNDDRNLLIEYRDGVKKAYQELITKREFSLDTDRQAKLVRPLYFNLLTDDQKEYAKNRLIKALDNYKWRLGTGFLSTPFILDTLSSIDKEYAYKLLLNEEMPGWLFMAKNDTGTIWEGWEGVYSSKGICSLNHYSKGAMTEWLFKSMLGINIENQNEILIKPIISDKVKDASGYYDSIFGRISVSYKIENKKVIFNINIPGNTKAQLIFNDKEYKLGIGENILEVVK